MIGHRFGRLMVLEYAPTPAGLSSRGRWARCLCDCGNMKAIRCSSLNQGSTASCGCYGRQQASKALRRNNKHFITGYNKPPGVAALRYYYRTYKYNAKARGLEFALTEAECAVLAASTCHYCGAPPAMPASRWPARCTLPRSKFGGLDRVDNALGYTNTNTVPCCSLCNHMKSDRNVKEWLSHMRKVLKHQQRDK